MYQSTGGHVKNAYRRVASRPIPDCDRFDRVDIVMISYQSWYQCSISTIIRDTVRLARQSRRLPAFCSRRAIASAAYDISRKAAIYTYGILGTKKCVKMASSKKNAN